jgi:hypothetical protein
MFFEYLKEVIGGLGEGEGDGEGENAAGPGEQYRIPLSFPISSDFIIPLKPSSFV